MKFGDNLKLIRKNKKMSQEQLAEKMNVSRQSVSKWETAEAYPEMNNILELLYSFLSEVSLKNQSSLSLSFFTSILPPFHPFLLLFFFLVLFILCSELSARSYFDIGTENLLQLSHPFNSDQYGQSPKSYWTMTIMKLSKVFHLIKVIINMNRLSCFHSILFVSIVI